MKIESKSHYTELEKDVINGLIRHSDEIRFDSTTNDKNKNIVFPLYQKKINSFEYEFLKSYYYALYTGSLKNDRILIQNYNALGARVNPVIMAPRISCIDDNGLAVIENDYIFINLKYEGAAYQITVFSFEDDSPMCGGMKYFISVLGIDIDAAKNSEVIEYSISESIKNSYYRNKLLYIHINDDDNLDISEASIEEYSKEKLENIFIPENIKDELERFYQCVEKHSEIGYGLRYMFCGEPGTGKTKSVRTLINLCYKKATIIVVTGKIDFKVLFKLAKLLSPAIVCIDDLDLQFGSRENHFSPKSLGAFLQQLDGFDKNDVFLLSTTNDKELIDKAAQRPGRFDLIVDFAKLHKNNYRDIVEANCKMTEILDAFDDEILSDLKSKKVTGAYIVNLIKQLEIKIKLNNESDIKKYIQNFIKMSYKGFYKNGAEKDNEFGFQVTIENGFGD